jgi:ABC-2 type transport system permease protein
MPAATSSLALLPRQFGYELLKLFARPRTYIGFGIFLFFELLLLFLLQLPKARASYRQLLENNGYLFAEYFSGPTMAVVIVTTSVFFLGSLFLALVSGDIVAKEVEDGTMRMILNRPVSRLRVLLVKWASCLVYTFALLAFIGATSLLCGLIYRGWGSLFVYAPLQGVFAVYSPGEGLLRFGLAVFWLALVMSTVSSIGFLLSCLAMKPAAATILTLAFLFADFVMNNLPYFSSYERFFLTYHIGSWALTFQDFIPWPRLLESLLWLWTFNFTCFAIGVTAFCSRDFKS